MTTTCTVDKATMKVSTGGYRTERITCNIDGKYYDYDDLTENGFLYSFSKNNSATNALSCQLSFSVSDTWLYAADIIYATFKGSIEESVVGNWTLAP